MKQRKNCNKVALKKKRCDHVVRKCMNHNRHSKRFRFSPKKKSKQHREKKRKQTSLNEFLLSQKTAEGKKKLYGFLSVIDFFVCLRSILTSKYLSLLRSTLIANSRAGKTYRGMLMMHNFGIELAPFWEGPLSFNAFWAGMEREREI